MRDGDRRRQERGDGFLPRLLGESGSEEVKCAKCGGVKDDLAGIHSGLTLADGTWYCCGRCYNPPAPPRLLIPAVRTRVISSQVKRIPQPDFLQSDYEYRALIGAVAAQGYTFHEEPTMTGKLCMSLEGMDPVLVCGRPAGHSGLHVATALGGEILSQWGKAA